MTTMITIQIDLQVLSIFFQKLNKVHVYATSLASKKSSYLPKATTNNGKFNIRFNGAKLWNSIKEELKLARVVFAFKSFIHQGIFTITRTLKTLRDQELCVVAHSFAEEIRY